MGKPEHYSYGIIVALLNLYPDELLKDNSPKSLEAYLAIKTAVKETMKMQDGPEIMRAIDLRFFKRTHTVAGVAMKLHVSERVAQSWCHDFIYLVARKLNYIDQSNVRKKDHNIQ